jgi:hypothetical protein
MSGEQFYSKAKPNAIGSPTAQQTSHKNNPIVVKTKAQRQVTVAISLYLKVSSSTYKSQVFFCQSGRIYLAKFN